VANGADVVHPLQQVTAPFAAVAGSGAAGDPVRGVDEQPQLHPAEESGLVKFGERFCERVELHQAGIIDDQVAHRPVNQWTRGRSR
jgi:hypothetical protein